MKDFVCEEIRIEKNDTIYMFTDGYNDQFGGPDKKKFSRKRLIELLHKTHAQPMDLQKKTLSDTFCTWKGELTQTDDVLVAGFRF
jgi:serine phosphatase RsbU (regulator of sigma subunit)